MSRFGKCVSCEANARLIVGAPDLLAAAVAVTRVLGLVSTRGAQAQAYVDECRAALDLAIARARGEAS